MDNSTIIKLHNCYDEDMNLEDLNKIIDDDTANTSKLHDIAPTTTKTPGKPKVSKKVNRPPTRKEKAFVKHLIENPKSTITEAYTSAYNVKPTTKQASIHSQASATLHKPTVISELSKYSNLVENTIINTVNEWGNEENTRRREIAINSAMYVHDKIFGKAKQSIQTESKVVSININLTGDDEKPPENL